MTKRIVNAIKTIGLFFVILISIVACEKDFEDIGVGLVDNNLFSTEVASYNVVANNVNVDSSRVDDLPQHLLGIYKDHEFGYLKASFVGQLGFVASNFGDNVSIDTIVLDIPYYATRVDDVNGKPNFTLDSIMGNRDEEYTLSVYELGTYLNILDPLDPTKQKKYYSNEQYTKKDLLYSGLFKPNSNDTVQFVKRRFLDEDRNSVDDIDTIKKSDLAPSIKIPLDTTFFRNHFIEQQDSEFFDSSEAFLNYFRGVLIEPEGEVGSLMTLAMSDATITIYYTNDVLTNETDTDLNGDGDTNDINVPVRTKQSKVYTISGKRANQYVRDYTGSEVEIYVNNPDEENGKDKLFLQGAAGTNAVVDLFNDISIDSLNRIRDENWLINEANLTFYLDDSEASNIPEQLFLYNYEDNSHIKDMISEYNFDGIGGDFIRGDDNNSSYYKFRITDYISDLLKPGNTLEPKKLAIKVYHTSDEPDITSISDTIVRDYSWIAKGVVLKGNKIIDTEKLKLEIYYTKNNIE